MKIRPVGAELSHAERRTDGRKDRHNEANSRFRNFVNAPKYETLRETSIFVRTLSMEAMRGAILATASRSPKDLYFFLLLRPSVFLRTLFLNETSLVFSSSRRIQNKTSHQLTLTTIQIMSTKNSALLPTAVILLVQNHCLALTFFTSSSTAKV